MKQFAEIELDSGQRGVAAHQGRLLVLGGPGSGKTTALEHRYLRLAGGEVGHHRILLLCTNRAYSIQAKDRLAWALPVEAMVEVPVYTWHALAYHLVTRYYPHLGYREVPVLLTGPEQWGAVRELLAAEQKVDWPVWGERLAERGFVDEVADFCLRVEQRLMSEEDLQSLAGGRAEWAEVIRFFSRYRDYLRRESRLDYAGLIAAAVRLLNDRVEVSEAIQRRFPHVLVDDAQEMSLAHRELLRNLATDNLVVAGDPDSGIETFRGAEPDWLLGFEKWFGPHETVVLQTSHRISEPLHRAAAALIAHNDPAPGHRIRDPAAHTTEIQARLYSSTAEEVEEIARELRHLHLVEGVPWSEMAVLVSQPAQLLAPLQRALHRWEVPFRPASGDRPLAAEPSVACFLDLARVALRLPGWEQVLPNLLTCPLIGLDYADRRMLERSAWQQGRTLADLAGEADETAELRTLISLVVEHQGLADECFWKVFSTSSYYRRLCEAAPDPGHPDNDHLDALVAFSHALGRFVERRHGKGSISEYLREAARADFGGDPWLAPARPQGDEGISLLSFHAARGRQWHTVVVCGCLDAWIPKGKRARGLFDPFALEVGEVADREVEAIADDRRTFYVAATRATSRTILTVSRPASGRGRPTRFLSELSVAPLEFAEPVKGPPLTTSELRALLRRTLAGEKSAPEEKVAALLALAEIPGVDPLRWYGRWDWTEGAAPLALPGEFRTSYSRIGVYENCGLQYVLESVLGLDPTSTEAMKFGTWMHALFEAVHNRRINDPPTLMRAYRDLFDETVFPNKAIANQYRRDGEKMLELFWKHEFTQDNVYTELDFEFPYEGAILRGRIDRLDKTKRGLKLTDYKTARWAPSRQEAATSLQLAIYFLAARLAVSVEAGEGEDLPRLTEVLKQIGGEPIVARLVFPGSTYSDGNPKVLTQNPEQADEVLAGLPQLIADVLAEQFRPSPEADCFFCRMKPLCPLWPEGREVAT